MFQATCLPFWEIIHPPFGDKNEGVIKTVHMTVRALYKPPLMFWSSCAEAFVDIFLHPPMDPPGTPRGPPGDPPGTPPLSLCVGGSGGQPGALAAPRETPRSLHEAPPEIPGSKTKRGVFLPGIMTYIYIYTYTRYIQIYIYKSWQQDPPLRVHFGAWDLRGSLME